MKMKKLLILAVVLLALLAVWQVTLVSAGDGCPPRCAPGTGTPGYWKNHPEAWRGGTITIGGVIYDMAGAIAIMDGPVRGDKCMTMFGALVAAKLNVLVIGPDPARCTRCIADTIAEADAWMTTYCVGRSVRANSEEWQYSHGERLYRKLDKYNNGRWCAPSRDALE